MEKAKIISKKLELSKQKNLSVKNPFKENFESKSKNKEEGNITYKKLLITTSTTTSNPKEEVKSRTTKPATENSKILTSKKPEKPVDNDLAKNESNQKYSENKEVYGTEFDIVYRQDGKASEKNLKENSDVDDVILSNGHINNLDEIIEQKNQIVQTKADYSTVTSSVKNFTLEKFKKKILVNAIKQNSISKHHNNKEEKAESNFEESKSESNQNIQNIEIPEREYISKLKEDYHISKNKKADNVITTSKVISLNKVDGGLEVMKKPEYFKLESKLDKVSTKESLEPLERENNLENQNDIQLKIEDNQAKKVESEAFNKTPKIDQRNDTKNTEKGGKVLFYDKRKEGYIYRETVNNYGVPLDKTKEPLNTAKKESDLQKKINSNKSKINENQSIQNQQNIATLNSIKAKQDSESQFIKRIRCIRLIQKVIKMRFQKKNAYMKKIQKCFRGFIYRIKLRKTVCLYLLFQNKLIKIEKLMKVLFQRVRLEVIASLRSLPARNYPPTINIQKQKMLYSIGNYSKDYRAKTDFLVIIQTQRKIREFLAKLKSKIRGYKKTDLLTFFKFNKKPLFSTSKLSEHNSSFYQSTFFHYNQDKLDFDEIEAVNYINNNLSISKKSYSIIPELECSARRIQKQWAVHKEIIRIRNEIKPIKIVGKPESTVFKKEITSNLELRKFKHVQSIIKKFLDKVHNRRIFKRPRPSVEDTFETKSITTRIIDPRIISFQKIVRNALRIIRTAEIRLKPRVYDKVVIRKESVQKINEKVISRFQSAVRAFLSKIKPTTAKKLPGILITKEVVELEQTQKVVVEEEPKRLVKIPPICYSKFVTTEKPKDNTRMKIVMPFLVNNNYSKLKQSISLLATKSSIIMRNTPAKSFCFSKNTTNKFYSNKLFVIQNIFRNWKKNRKTLRINKICLPNCFSKDVLPKPNLAKLILLQQKLKGKLREIRTRRQAKKKQVGNPVYLTKSFKKDYSQSIMKVQSQVFQFLLKLKKRKILSVPRISVPLLEKTFVPKISLRTIFLLKKIQSTFREKLSKKAVLKSSFKRPLLSSSLFFTKANRFILGSSNKIIELQRILRLRRKRPQPQQFKELNITGTGTYTFETIDYKEEVIVVKPNLTRIEVSSKLTKPRINLDTLILIQKQVKAFLQRIKPIIKVKPCVYSKPKCTTVINKEDEGEFEVSVNKVNSSISYPIITKTVRADLVEDKVSTIQKGYRTKAEQKVPPKAIVKPVVFNMEKTSNIKINFFQLIKVQRKFKAYIEEMHEKRRTRKLPLRKENFYMTKIQKADPTKKALYVSLKLRSWVKSLNRTQYMQDTTSENLTSNYTTNNTILIKTPEREREGPSMRRKPLPDINYYATKSLKTKINNIKIFRIIKHIKDFYNKYVKKTNKSTKLSTKSKDDNKSNRSNNASDLAINLASANKYKQKPLHELKIEKPDSLVYLEENKGARREDFFKDTSKYHKCLESLSHIIQNSLIRNQLLSFKDYQRTSISKELIQYVMDKYVLFRLRGDKNLLSQLKNISTIYLISQRLGLLKEAFTELKCYNPMMSKEAAASTFDGILKRIMTEVMFDASLHNYNLKAIEITNKTDEKENKQMVTGGFDKKYYLDLAVGDEILVDYIKKIADLPCKKEIKLKNNIIEDSSELNQENNKDNTEIKKKKEEGEEEEHNEK